jgi:hypothetical protein
MVRFGFGFPRRTRPAYMQAIREKAAEGIRTLDLLHGNYAGLLPDPLAKTLSCRDSAGAAQTAAIGDVRGYAPIRRHSGTRAPECLKYAMAV